ncbi:MAG: PDZ domain-containing protein [Candidatus Vogelbacteria bacterium]|nr:PDZ domain-containing protein [Candidatus Vogelbacteria bacterium]
MRRICVVLVTLFLVSVCTSSIAAQPKTTVSPDFFTAREAEIINDPGFQSFLNALTYVKRFHIKGKEISTKQLLFGAIRGAVAAIDDKYSEFIPAEEEVAYFSKKVGVYPGFGFTYKIVGGYPTVFSVDEGDPAAEAGLKVGDVIYRYNATPLQSIPLKKVSIMMTPDTSNTKAILSVGRGNPRTSVEITMTSTTIEYSAVTSSVLTCPAGYSVTSILIDQFTENAVQQLDQIMGDILRTDCRGIVLDLRDCGGGCADAAEDILSYFIGDGVLITTQECGDGRHSDSRSKQSKFRKTLKTHRPMGWEKIRRVPVVCLVNRGTASASEVVALALREYHHAPLIGEKTFGKGVGQTYLKLGSLGQIKLTTNRWTSAKGVSVQGVGIKPDYEIKDHEAQVNKALSLFK